MKRPTQIVGALLVLVGLVWIGQGLGLIPGSFMTRDSFWAAAGIVAALVGAWLIRTARPSSR